MTEFICLNPLQNLDYKMINHKWFNENVYRKLKWLLGVQQQQDTKKQQQRLYNNVCFNG